jgi:leader peptidase (prepilin peptidase)/N-methyltransferase
MVPVLSHLVLRGRCRYCGARIPPRLLLVELASGAIFTVIYLMEFAQPAVA